MFVNALASALPDGVLQVVQGDGSVGEQLVSSDDVHMIAMTGSSATGKKIMEKSAKNLKRLVLELGGKDPMVIFADADLDKAAEDAVANSVFNAGQVCCAVERIYIEQSVKAEFEQKVVELAKKHKVGDGSDIGVTMGPMVSQMQLEIVKQQVEDSIAHGATKLYESDVPAGGGNWCPIMVLTDLKQDMLIQRAETFGPVVALSTFDGTEGEAVKLANDTEYGLASYVYTQDLMKASRVARKIKAGQVGINCYSLVAAQPKCPWCVDTSNVGPKFALLFISHKYLFSFGTPILIHKGLVTKDLALDLILAWMAFVLSQCPSHLSTQLLHLNSRVAPCQIFEQFCSPDCHFYFSQQGLL
jgi:acyl-CoA reductase-like NAD-dependent aldehyde dehydrogenase